MADMTTEGSVRLLSLEGGGGGGILPGKFEI